MLSGENLRVMLRGEESSFSGRTGGVFVKRAAFSIVWLERFSLDLHCLVPSGLQQRDSIFTRTKSAGLPGHVVQSQDGTRSLARYSMNILDAVAISLPCHSCGGNYQVPLRDVLLSHTVLHEGCPVSQETECLPVFQSRLFERGEIEELQRVWSRLENRARSDGGELVLLGAPDLAETEPVVPTQTDAETARRREAAQLTILSGKHDRESTRGATKKRETRKRQKRTRTKEVIKAKNKKIA